MKKTITITFIVGIIINVLVNLLIPENALEKLLFLYVYFPICFLAVGYGLKFAGIKDSAWIATVVNAPFALGFIGLLFGESNLDLFWQWICRTPLFAILISIVILEYKICKLFFQK